MNEQELYRHIIDGCDEALRDAFLRRMEMSLKIAESKLASGAAVHAPVREQEVIDNMTKGLSPELALKATSLWRSLMRMSRQRQYTFLINNKESITLLHEKDILHTPPTGDILCILDDAPVIEATYNMKTQTVPSFIGALDSLEREQCPYAAIAIDDFYGSDWIFSLIYNRNIYLNSVTLAKNGKHVFLLSKKLYDMPENNMVTIAFSIPIEQHGSLAQILEVFADLKINLEYLRFKTLNYDDDARKKQIIIFATYSSSLTSVSMRSALLQLESEVPFVKVIGYRPAID